MKYFLDTEFIEGFHKPFFGKRRHHIDLISIGIVAEDGRTYKAISNEYKWDDASQWVKDNVIIPLYKSTVSGYAKNHCDASNFQKAFGKSNADIAKEVIDFIGRGWEVPEFYGYYADYDWVLLCSLFGTMMDLPRGWPMYCRDLKQMLDEKVEKMKPASANFEEVLNTIKLRPSYPKEENEHNALADAYWNKALYDFIKFL